MERAVGFTATVGLGAGVAGLAEDNNITDLL
jgi:hypothetical protein